MLTQKAFIPEAESKGVILPRCCICNEVPPEGICGGMIMKQSFLCQKCEEAIIRLTAESANYHEVLGRIKALFK